jgi:predicted acyltransferase
MSTHPIPSQTSILAIPPSQRLLSLDVLRGLTVALMILVNNAGDGKVSYPQLRHSVWNGCTLTDIVFPTFLFMVGASIALSFRRRIQQNAPHGVILLQVLKRSLLIFIIGLFLNALPFFQFATLRYYGVLQRIALCYLFASIIYLFSGVTGTAIATVISVIGYWFLLTHVRVPGFGMPGVDIPILDPVANLASWLDRTLVSPAHIYRHTVYDPEGLLSTISALATTLFGILAASVLQTSRSARQKAITLLLSGVILIAAGLLWSHWLPLNKRIWTSSYCLYTAGIATTLLTALYYFIDGPPQLRRGLTPWLVFGTNALTAYIFSEVLAIILGAVTVSSGHTLQKSLYTLLPQFLISPSLLSATWSVLFVAVCFLPVLYLYRHKVFLKL